MPDPIEDHLTEVPAAQTIGCSNPACARFVMAADLLDNDPSEVFVDETVWDEQENARTRLYCSKRCWSDDLGIAPAGEDDPHAAWETAGAQR